MSAPAIIQGSYADLKLVRTRKVAQIIIEAPLERLPEIVAAFGAPNPAAEVPVAVARLNETAGVAGRQTPVQGDDDRGSDAVAMPPASAERSSSPAPKKPRSLAVRAWDHIHSPSFAGYLWDRHHRIAENFDHLEVDAIDRNDAVLKAVLRIGSKSELNADAAAGQRFENLIADFHDWQRQQSEIASTILRRPA